MHDGPVDDQQVAEAVQVHQRQRRLGGGGWRHELQVARHHQRQWRGRRVTPGGDHAHQQVTFGEQAGHQAVLGHDQQRADLAPGHQCRGLGHAGRGRQPVELVGASVLDEFGNGQGVHLGPLQ
ncbi:MAG: hypothetical protein MUC86_17545 [Burkholderiaceae bacterium]|nr:hypothetical protein [Burkholderiaceae bacterium]